MELFNQAVQVVKGLFEAGHPVVVGASFGKDSSAVLAIALEAAQIVRRNGGEPFLVVTHADTEIENPEMRRYADGEIERLLSFADKAGIELSLHVARPTLNDSWLTRVLSGRALPSFPGSNGDCTTTLKIVPMQRVVKDVMRTLERFDKEAVTLIGTRFEESVTRGNAMAKRGESADTPVRNKDGKLILSPIAMWSEDDVWELVGEVMNARIKTYSDFTQLYALYRDGAGGGCVITFAEVSKARGEERKQAGGCGARFGCFLCTKVKDDKSMSSLLEQEPSRYGYMRGLNALRDYIVATHWDMNRRYWLGRSIVKGFVRVQPDSYSPQHCLDLLRMCLTLDIEEKEVAAKLGIKPRFEMITRKVLVVIDAIWSLQGYHRPFEAVKQWHEIVNEGKRYPVPKVAEVPRGKIPATRYLEVGDQWDDGRELGTGLRSLELDLANQDFQGGCMGHKWNKSSSVDRTQYFFSSGQRAVEDLPIGSVVAVADKEAKAELEAQHPGLEVVVFKGKASETLARVESGELAGAFIEASKLSKGQKQAATGVGQAKVEYRPGGWILDANTDSEISVNLESAEIALTYELENLLKANAECDGKTGLTYGYRWWTRFGTLALFEKGLVEADTIVRRTIFKERVGLCGQDYSIETLQAMSVDAKEFARITKERAAQGPRFTPAQLAEIERRVVQEEWKEKIAQERISLRALYKDWAKGVNWKELIRSGELRSVLLPRPDKAQRRLTLKRLVHKTELVRLLKQNKVVATLVQNHRTSKKIRLTHMLQGDLFSAEKLAA